MRLAFFQPDIPQNLGAAIRLAACLGAPLEVIGPCAFPMGAAALRRAAMDYAARADVAFRSGWADFLAAPGRADGRLILLSTAAETRYDAFSFGAGDTLLLGRESAGAPDHVHAAAHARVRIPMSEGARSLNVVVAAAMVLGEALRQTGGFPGPAAGGDGG